MHRNLISRRTTFWHVSMIRRWEEPYESAGVARRCFGLVSSHLLWDVFPTMKEKRAAWNRDGCRVNINFRSQNLSVCCRLDLSSSWKSARLTYVYCRLICLCVCRRVSKARGWLIFVGKQKYPSSCVRITVTPISANVLHNLVCHGPEG